MNKRPKFNQLLDFIDPEYSSNLIFEQEKIAIHNSKMIIACVSSVYQFQGIYKFVLEESKNKKKQIFTLLLEPDCHLFETIHELNCNPIYDLSIVHNRKLKPEWGDIDKWYDENWVEEFYTSNQRSINNSLILNQILYDHIDNCGLIKQLSDF